MIVRKVIIFPANNALNQKSFGSTGFATSEKIVSVTLFSYNDNKIIFINVLTAVDT